MSQLQDRYIRFDWAIRRLLRQKANFGVLEGFLTVFLGEPITIMEILESKDTSLSEGEKNNWIGIMAHNDKDENIIIEIQIKRLLHYIESIYYGITPSNIRRIRLGDSYREVKKVYSISILYFDLGVGSDYLYHGQNHFIGVHTGDQLQIRTKEQNAIITRLPAEIFPEYILIRVNEFDKVAVTPLDEWMRYLKDGIIAADTTAPGLGEAREKLKYYSMTDKERRAYDEHLNAIMIQNDVLNAAKLEGQMEGRMEGREEGRMEERLSNARNLKKMGVSAEIIAQATGLSVEEVDKL